MIICVGTSPAVQRTMTFERLRLGEVNRAISVQQFASGKSINAARVVHALAEAHFATGFVGGDTGRFIQEDLNRTGIQHDFVQVETPTRICVTILDESRQTGTELIENAAAVARESYDRLLEKLAARMPQAKALILSGTLPTSGPPHFYSDCIALAETNLPVILDAKGESLDWALQRRPFVVKPNRSELAQTLEADVDDDDALRGAMRQIVARGAQWVVITDGARPMWLSDGRHFWRIEAPRLSPSNPIGSGDAFAAGLAVGLIRGQTVPQACQLAVACGAANALTRQAGHVHLRDVQELLPRVDIQQYVPD